MLENYHASFVFATLTRNPSTDFLANLSRASYREFRKAVISMILATDMARHGAHVDSLRAFADRTSFTSLTRHSFSDKSDSDDRDSRVASPRRRQFYLDQLIHLGDMSAVLALFRHGQGLGRAHRGRIPEAGFERAGTGPPVSPFMARLRNGGGSRARTGRVHRLGVVQRAFRGGSGRSFRIRARSWRAGRELSEK